MHPPPFCWVFEPPTKFSNNRGVVRGGLDRIFSSVITNILNIEILTKNLVTFKRWDRDKDEIFLKSDF